jgi:type II secretory pathway component PulK
MNPRSYNRPAPDRAVEPRPAGLRATPSNGSVLIIVLWVTFGMISLALYFAHSMSMELKAADNYVASLQAEQAIEGGAVYVSNLLATLAQPNLLPDPENYRAEGVKVGEATFWLIGRDTNDSQSAPQGEHPVWGLMDEASKVNLNFANVGQLGNLPQMTSNLAAAIYDWQSTNTTPSSGGAKSETYSTQAPSYNSKNTNYETIDEVRMVYGMTMDLLYGEDANRNGIIDPNENDGDTLPPHDNQDGILDPGILEYLTVWTHEPAMLTNTQPRIAVNSPGLTAYLTQYFPSLNVSGGGRAGGRGATGGGGLGAGGGGAGGAGGRGGGAGAGAAATYNSVLDFYVQSGLSETDFEQVEPCLMNPQTNGLINVNTATATVLSCIPGIGVNSAPQVLSFRQSNPTRLTSIAWIKDAMSLTAGSPLIAQIGPYITSRSFQFTADIAAVGRNGRGYRRVQFVFDCSSGVPLIVYRQDLTHLGWALGKKLHDQLLAQGTK